MRISSFEGFLLPVWFASFDGLKSCATNCCMGLFSIFLLGNGELLGIQENTENILRKR